MLALRRAVEADSIVVVGQGKKLLEEIASAREVLAEGDGSRDSSEDYFFDGAYDLFEALQVSDR